MCPAKKVTIFVVVVTVCVYATIIFTHAARKKKKRLRSDFEWPIKLNKILYQELAGIPLFSGTPMIPLRAKEEGEGEEEHEKMNLVGVLSPVNPK